jgi:Ca2+-binding RTX toxin-like protein
MQHTQGRRLLRRVVVPALAAGVLTLPALTAAHAASDPAAGPGSTAAGDTPPAGLLCNGQTPTIWATADNQTVPGTIGNDIIAANGFHGLSMKGGAGDDTICAANDASGTISNTTLDGGTGNDTLISTGGRDRLIGGAGNDKINGTINSDVVYSTDAYLPGTPGITVNLPAHTVTGTVSGTDTLAGLNQSRIFGTPGNDVFTGDDMANWFDSGAGADSIHGYGGNDWFHGVDPKSISGNAGDDTITVGYGGTVSGGKGEDTIAADPNNALSGASPDAGVAVTGYTLKGASGDDTIKVNTLKTGSDTWSQDAAYKWKGSVAGGKGKDTVDFAWLGTQGVALSVKAGIAHWPAGTMTFASVDKILGTPGNDVLKGGPDNDILVGQAGQDTIRGRQGDDTLKGKQDNDMLFGGRGHDRVLGGAATDTCKSAEWNTHCELF